jgi:hypothetical protein
MDATNVWGISGNWAEIYHSCFVRALKGDVVEAPVYADHCVVSQSDTQ